MKIAKIEDEALIFDNGHILESTHDQDCCEWHWLDFSVMINYNVSPKTGKEIDIYEQKFDFTDGVPFERVENVGIMLIDTDGNKYLICGYGSNNGYYGDNINLEYKDENGNIIFEYDVSECQVISE